MQPGNKTAGFLISECRSIYDGLKLYIIRSKVLIKHFEQSIVLISMIVFKLYMNLTYNFSHEGEVSISPVVIDATKIQSIVYSPLLLISYEKNIKKDSLNLLFPYSGI
jgi:hypothetical protein